jgi:hypothetical protein
MDDARTSDATDSAQLTAAMVEQCIYQSVLLVAGGRMDYQVWRLIEHEQRFIFIKDLQGELFGRRDRALRFRPMHLYNFSGTWRVRRLGQLAIHRDMSLFNEPANGAS